MQMLLIQPRMTSKIIFPINRYKQLVIQLFSLFNNNRNCITKMTIIVKSFKINRIYYNWKVPPKLLKLIHSIQMKVLKKIIQKFRKNTQMNRINLTLVRNNKSINS